MSDWADKIAEELSFGWSTTLPPEFASVKIEGPSTETIAQKLRESCERGKQESDERIKELEQQREALRDALSWCSGAEAFSPGGIAQEGWLRVCRPLLVDLDSAGREYQERTARLVKAARWMLSDHSISGNCPSAQELRAALSGFPEVK